MKDFYNKKSLFRRMALLLVLPLLWVAVIGLQHKPVDTRTKDGVAITMEEPLGGWRYDSDMASDCPVVADSLRNGAIGDAVYEARIAYFPRVLMTQALYVLLATLLVIFLHDIVTIILIRKNKK